MNSAVRHDKPTLSDKVIRAQFVRMIEQHPPLLVNEEAAPSPSGEVMHADPQIKLIKEGGTVKTIEVRCACGAVIRLDCEY